MDKKKLRMKETERICSERINYVFSPKISGMVLTDRQIDKKKEKKDRQIDMNKPRKI